MSQFNTKLDSLRIKESVVDIERSDLDSTVFQYVPNKDKPVLQPSIKMQILEDLGHIQEIVSVSSFFIVGSILTKKYNADSDIDVTLELPPEEINDFNYEQLLSTLSHVNGHLAVGTTHPINYKIIKQPASFENYDAVYDVASEQWLKEPTPYQTDLDKYMGKFESEVASMDINTGKLRREIIDIGYLRSLEPDQVKDLSSRIESKLHQIEDTIDSLVDEYQDIKKIRALAYEQPWDAEKIKEFGVKNNLPQNIIYKLLEKYYYLDFMKKLKLILHPVKRGPKKKLEVSDIKSIKSAFLQAYMKGLSI